MQYRRLGRTNLNVSLVSYGSGGPSRLGQGTGLNDDEQNALIRRCLDEGINFIDSAAGYGESEVILGRALKGVSRDSYTIATKWGPGGRNSVRDNPQELVDSVENSLKRLNVDVIDIMQFHGVLPNQVDQVVERFYPTMEKLRDAGKFRYIGITEMFFGDPSHDALEIALTKHSDLWDTVMLKYGILNMCAADAVLPLAKRHDVGVLNMASVRVKLTRPDELEALIAEWKERGLIPADSLSEKDPLGWLAHDKVESVVAAGYKFAADHDAISTVLTGTSKIANLESNLRALEDPTLPKKDADRLRELFGGLAEGA